MSSPVEILKEAKTLGGFYKGKPSNPDTVKKTVDFQGLKIKIDRPRGFIMFGVDDKGKEWKRRYKVDYGFIPKTLGGDGDGLDIFLGPHKKSKKAFWAIQRHADGSFDEYKIFLGYENRDAAIATYRDHIPKKFFGRMVTTTVEMMKAMLGTNPEEAVAATKTASIFDAFFKEAASTMALEEQEEGGGHQTMMQQLAEQQAKGQDVVPRYTDLKHPGHKYLKRDAVMALVKGVE